MLDIEYIKQIDEVLDMPDFKLDTNFYGNTLVIYNGSLNIRFEAGNGGNIGAYYFYLVRVIEAINKKYNEDDNYFCYRIIQKDDLIEVLFIDEHCESYSGLTDESKESSIVHIMDHIKEKV